MAKSAMHKKGSAVREELMGKAMAATMAKTVYNDPLMEGFADWTREAVSACSGPGRASTSRPAP